MRTRWIRDVSCARPGAGTDALWLRHGTAMLSVCLLLTGAGQCLAWQAVLQAEDLDGSWREQTNISGYLGRGFRTSNANPDVSDSVLRGTVDLPADETYIVWSRGYTSPGDRRGYRVRIGTTLLERTHEEGRRGWWWRRCGAVALPEGRHPVEVVDAGRGFESVDVIVITDEEAYDPMAEDGQWLSFGTELPHGANALEHTIAACTDVCRQRSTPGSRVEWERRRPGIRLKLAEALGLEPLPPRTPLNARVTGRTERDGYRVENILFESRPGFYVTANLTMPTNIALPVPAVVVVPGHAMQDGKNYGLYRKAQLGLVRLGLAVLAYDPIGQGERKRPGFDHVLGYTSLMVGQCNEGMIVWDSMRAVDYLCSRPDIDAARIGLAGNSGGGENTFYTMPLEPRIAAGASFCFVCSYEMWLKEGGNHCICNHMPGIIQHMEQFEIVGLSAPRPFLFGNAVEDPIFPIEGTRSTLERAQTVYQFYDAEDRIRLVEGPGGHGWSQPLREAAYGWFSKWLLDKGDGSPIAEPPLPDEPDDAVELLCIKPGEAFPEDAETVITLNRKRAATLAQSRSAPTPETLWHVLGGRPDNTDPVAEVIRAFKHPAGSVETLALSTEADVQVGATLVLPADGSPQRAVVMVTSGPRRTAAESDMAARFLARGSAVMVLNPRGTGEASVHENHLTSDTVCLGRPLFAQQLWDVIQTVAWCAERLDLESGSVVVTGTEACGMLAACAGALAPCGGIIAESIPLSYIDTIDNHLSYPLWFYVPRILTVADVEDILALAAPKPCLILDPVGRAKQPIGETTAGQKLHAAIEAYGEADAVDSLTIQRSGDTSAAAAVDAWLNRIL